MSAVEIRQFTGNYLPKANRFVTPLLERTCCLWLVQRQKSCLTRVPIDKILWLCFNINSMPQKSIHVFPYNRVSFPFESCRNIANSDFELTVESFFSILNWSLIYLQSIKALYIHKTLENDTLLWACDLCFTCTNAQHTITCHFFF